MASIAVYLSAAVLLAQSTVAFNCSIPPIYVDIHKRAVHESSAFQYGSFIGVGSPAQNHSLWPSISQNHTSFGLIDYCDNSTLKNCPDATGGLFVQDDSTSFQPNPSAKFLDNSRNRTFVGFLAQETLRLYTHYFETDGASQTLVEDSLVEFAEEGSIAPGRVGVGTSSTLLQTLANKNLIAGRTYSLYLGHGFDRAGGAVNGSNVFGGYDSGRFTGDVHRYDMKASNTSPFTVRVKDVYITMPGDAGEQVSLLDIGKFPVDDEDERPGPFEAQISTDQFPLSLPYTVTQNFRRHLDAQDDNTWGDDSLKLRNPFSGSLSVVLEDGFTVTLPPEMLSNASNITPVQKREKGDERPFLLGAAFLTQVYLMADFDAYTFYLADAVQKNNVVMPVTFCPKSTPTPYSRPKQNAWVKEGLIGAVVGGVLGGIGIGVCMYCFAVAWMRRRVQKKQEAEWERQLEAKGMGGKKMQQLEIEEVVPQFEGPPRRKEKRALFPWMKR